MHWRDGLTPGTALAGPAIIEAMDLTSLVPPSWQAQVDELDTLSLRGAKRRSNLLDLAHVVGLLRRFAPRNDRVMDLRMQRLKTDPARFEVVKNALTCAAEEMKIVLAKTAYSPLLKVAGDYSCGIFDVAGNMVAQGPDLPIHLGSMPDAVRAVVRAFPDVGAGRRVHSQRSVSGRLAFAGRERCGAGIPRGPAARLWLRARALAGYRQRHAGQLRRGDGNLWRGLRLPPIRLYRDGKPDPAIEAIIFANVRTPPNDWAICARRWRRTGVPRQRLQELAAKYGADTLLDIMQEVLDYSETMMRAALRALPDGEAEFTDSSMATASSRPAKPKTRPSR